MSPAVAWLVAELTKLALTRVVEAGKFESLEQQEAEAMVQKIATELSSKLPTPEELEKQGADATSTGGSATNPS